LEGDIEQVLAGATSVDVPIGDLWNPDACPAHLLPWLAWALSVDEWDSGWSETTKRRTLMDSIGVHRSKGTVAAVKTALAAAGYGAAEVIEWFGWEQHDGTYSYDGSIYYSTPDHWAEYRIKLTRPITVEQAAQVREILDAVAPARCHLKALSFTTALNLYDARIEHDGAYTHGVA
jgi:phage tail P2-like protein